MRKASLETWGDVEGYRQRLIQSFGRGCVATSACRQGGAVCYFFQGPAAGVTADHETQGPSGHHSRPLTGVRLFFAARLRGQVPSFRNETTAIGYFSSRVHSAAPLSLPCPTICRQPLHHSPASPRQKWDR